MGKMNTYISLVLLYTVVCNGNNEQGETVYGESHKHNLLFERVVKDSTAFLHSSEILLSMNQVLSHKRQTILNTV